MKKLVSVAIATATMSMIAGCAVDSADVAGESSSDVSQASCANPEGTNAMIAALATAIASNMHRIEVLTDFYVYVGYQNQRMLGISSTGLAQCQKFGSTCDDVKFLLMFQDSHYDQKLTFGTNKLSSWSYASRLTTGWDNQVACKRNNTCPYPVHQLTQTTVAPGGCATLFTYNVTNPSTGAVIADPSKLNNALVFTYGNGPNPYIAFQAGLGTMTIDPDGGVVGGDTSGSTSGASTCPTAGGVNNLGTIYATCQVPGTAGTDLTGQACQAGAACGTLYKAWPSFPNKYKCNAQGC
jgi:hypothetical protein